MSISHDANEILVSGTETGDALRTYMNTNSLGTVHDRTAILDRNINLDTDASFTDHDCTWIFPSTYHWNFNKNPQPTLFELEDAVIVYTDGAKSHSDQPRAETIRLINVQYRIEGNTGRTDFFGWGTHEFDFSNVQFITYGGTNYLHLETSGGLLEDVAVKVGAGNLIYQPDARDNTTLILRNWTLDSKISLIQGNGGASLDATTRLENLSWGKTIWYIGTGGRGQHYKVINPIKPSGWRFYKGSTDTTKCRCDEYHTHNVRIVDEDNNALSGFAVHLRRSDGTVVYELTTDSNGAIAEQEVMTYEQTGQTGAHTGADFTQYNGFSLAGLSYSNKLVSGVKNLADGRIDEVIGSFTDATITDTKVTADDYQEIDTPQKFYNRAKAYLVDNFAGETATIVSRAGSEIDLGSYNLTIDSNASSVFAFDGTTITIKASTFVGNLTTTGVITLTGSNVQGRYTDANGTNIVLEYAVSSIEAGSTLQIYNITKSQEVVNQVISGTSTSGTYTTSQIEAGDNVRIRLTCQAGSSAFLPYEAFGVATSAGISFIADQQADTVYNDNGIDGSTVSTLTADYPNVQIDISDGDGVADSRELYAFAVYQSTTSTGIENWFNAITAINPMNYRINVSNADIKLQNRGSIPLVISGARIFRSDGTSVLHADAGDKPMTQDTGELLQYIKPQVNSAMNTNTKLDGVSKNTKIIPALL